MMGEISVSWMEVSNEARMKVMYEEVVFERLVLQQWTDMADRFPWTDGATK